MKKDVQRITFPGLHGAYQRPEDIRSWTQNFFLTMVWNVAQAPLHSLRDDVWPKYTAVFKSEQDRRVPAEEIQERAIAVLRETLRLDQPHPSKSTSKPKALRSGRALRAATELIHWGKRFNLRRTLDPGNEGWPLIAALETMFYWHFERKGEVFEMYGAPMWRQKKLSFDGRPAALGPIQLTFQHPGVVPQDTSDWWIEMEPESAFRRKVLKDFKRWLDNYVTARIASAKAAGFEKLPGKRDLAPFQWAAMFQVGGRSASDIAKEYNVTADAVEDGIQSVLSLIALERRAVKRGRKPLAAARS